MLIEQLKSDRRDAMKARNGCKSDILACVIADATRYDKSPDDDSTMSTIKKTLKSIRETQALVDRTPPEGEAKWYLLDQEAECLKKYLPQMISEEDLRAFISQQWQEMGGIDKKKMGQVMGAIKKEFGSSADMKIASQIIKES